MTSISTLQAAAGAPAATRYDVQRVRAQFPALAQTIYENKLLVYLDNAATTLKPTPVVDVIAKHYAMEASNIHRGLHYLSERATQAYEGARRRVAGFINAESEAEIIFTSGTTAAINLVALGHEALLRKGDEIVISHMEHHSNIVPWQMLRDRLGVVLKVVPINDDGELIFEAYEKMLSPRTRIVSMNYVSNSLGTVNPIKAVVDAARAAGAITLVDAAQAVSTRPVDVQALGCDFLAFSGHKLFGPTGVGVLYGRRERLEEMPPVFGGGDMIANVTFDETTYNTIPHKFEAGTANIAGVIGLGRAVEYVQALGLGPIAEHEADLLGYATQRLRDVPGVRIIGTAGDKVAIISFIVGDVHAHDVGSILDQDGVAIRAGHHCTQPVMDRFGVPATARASFSIYNTRTDVDALVSAVAKVKELFG
jgi:cysteine desulfurase/selenocysteine lyase